MSVELQGKTMVVIGGGSGIGRRIAVDAAAAGARVIVAGPGTLRSGGRRGIGDR